MGPSGERSPTRRRSDANRPRRAHPRPHDGACRAVVRPTPYDRCSLIADAPNLIRPLLLIHGLTDDNVVIAHTLRLSAALTVAGRPHQVLPLSGVGHMTPPEVAENRLVLELTFLKQALGV